jgi:hypothetical protein
MKHAKWSTMGDPSTLLVTNATLTQPWTFQNTSSDLTLENIEGSVEAYDTERYPDLDAIDRLDDDTLGEQGMMIPDPSFTKVSYHPLDAYLNTDEDADQAYDDYLVNGTSSVSIPTDSSEPVSFTSASSRLVAESAAAAQALANANLPQGTPPVLAAPVVKHTEADDAVNISSFHNNGVLTRLMYNSMYCGYVNRDKEIVPSVKRLMNRGNLSTPIPLNDAVSPSVLKDQCLSISSGAHILGVSPDIFELSVLAIPESRVDVVRFRAGLTPSRPVAHQLVRHGHVTMTLSYSGNGEMNTSEAFVQRHAGISMDKNTLLTIDAKVWEGLVPTMETYWDKFQGTRGVPPYLVPDFASGSVLFLRKPLDGEVMLPHPMCESRMSLVKV